MRLGGGMYSQSDSPKIKDENGIKRLMRLIGSFNGRHSGFLVSNLPLEIFLKQKRRLQLMPWAGV